MGVVVALLIIGLICWGSYARGKHAARNLAENGTSPRVRKAAGQARQQGQRARKAVRDKAPKAVKAGQVKASHIWHQALATNFLAARAARRTANPDSTLGWRERRRRRRAAVPPAPAPQPAPAPAPIPQPASQPFTPPRPAANGAPTNGRTPVQPSDPHLNFIPATDGTGKQFFIPVPKNGAPMTTNTTKPPTTGAGGDLFTAAQHVVGASLNGGLQSKRRGVHQMNEALVYLGGLLQQFANRLSEPDQGYPASITEPILQAAAHVTASGSKLGEADTALATLANTPMGEVAGSGVKSPHHQQVNSE